MSAYETRRLREVEGTPVFHAVFRPARASLKKTQYE
jgi:hypothetical protein